MVNQIRSYQLVDAAQNNYPTDKIPKVIAAAVVGHDNLVYVMPPPNRHHDLIRTMVCDLNHPTPISGDQGFYLSDGCYADRKLAKIFAEHHGQLLPTRPGDYEGELLFSENLW